MLCWLVGSPLVLFAEVAILLDHYDVLPGK